MAEDDMVKTAAWYAARLAEADYVIWLLKTDGVRSGTDAERWHAEACERHEDRRG